MTSYVACVNYVFQINHLYHKRQAVYVVHISYILTFKQKGFSIKNFICLPFGRKIILPNETRQFNTLLQSI